MTKSKMREIGKQNQKKRARKAVTILNKNYDRHDTRASIVDMITDLLHLCDERKLSYSELVTSARGHYLSEKSGEDKL